MARMRLGLSQSSMFFLIEHVRENAIDFLANLSEIMFADAIEESTSKMAFENGIGKPLWITDPHFENENGREKRTNLPPNP